MAPNFHRLRRAIFLSSSLIHNPLHQPKPISLSPSPFQRLSPTSSPASATGFSRLSRPLTTTTTLFLAERRKVFDPETDEIGPDTILFEGCDYNHWLITVDFPKDSNLTREEKIDFYINIAAQVFGSVEEAKKKIYALSTTTYEGFQVECSEETSNKFQNIPGVVFVLPDSYIDPVNKEYGGDKYVNGEIFPRPPPVHYGRRNNRDRRPREQYQQGNATYNNQGPPNLEARGPNYGSPPQQNYGPNYGSPPQQNYGPNYGSSPQQNYGPNYGSPPQQNYGPNYGSPPQPNYGHQPPQNYGPPPQQNYGPLSQQSYGLPPQQKSGQLPQQNYGSPSQPGFGPPQQSYGPSRQNYGPPPHLNNGSPQQQNYGRPPPQNNYTPSQPQQNCGQPSNFLQQNYGQPQSGELGKHDTMGGAGRELRNNTPSYQGNFSQGERGNYNTQGQRDFQQGRLNQVSPEHRGFSPDTNNESFQDISFDQRLGGGENQAARTAFGGQNQPNEGETRRY